MRFVFTHSLKTKKGFSLVEVIIGSAILSFVSLAIMKIFNTAFVSSNLTYSLMADQDLKQTLGQTLQTGQCEKSLAPGNLSLVAGTDTYTLTSLRKYRDASDTTGTELVKTGDSFKDFLEVIRMELVEPDTDQVVNNDKHKEFKVYYKREKVKHLSKKNQNPCTSADTSGCYWHSCKMEYETTGTGQNKTVSACKLLDCAGNTGAVQQSSVDCYEVEDSGDKKRLNRLRGDIGDRRGYGSDGFGVWSQQIQHRQLQHFHRL